MADFYPTWRTYRTFGAVHLVDQHGLEYGRLSLTTDSDYVAQCREDELLLPTDELLDYRIPIAVRRGNAKRPPYTEVGPEAGEELTLMDPMTKAVLFTAVVESIGMHFERNEVRSGTRTIGRVKVTNWTER